MATKSPKKNKTMNLMASMKLKQLISRESVRRLMVVADQRYRSAVTFIYRL